MWYTLGNAYHMFQGTFCLLPIITLGLNDLRVSRDKTGLWHPCRWVCCGGEFKVSLLRLWHIFSDDWCSFWNRFWKLYPNKMKISSCDKHGPLCKTTDVTERLHSAENNCNLKIWASNRTTMESAPISCGFQPQHNYLLSSLLTTFITCRPSDRQTNPSQNALPGSTL